MVKGVEPGGTKTEQISREIKQKPSTLNIFSYEFFN